MKHIDFSKGEFFYEPAEHCFVSSPALNGHYHLITTPEADITFSNYISNNPAAAYTPRANPPFTLPTDIAPSPETGLLPAHTIYNYRRHRVEYKIYEIEYNDLLIFGAAHSALTLVDSQTTMQGGTIAQLQHGSIYVLYLLPRQQAVIQNEQNITTTFVWDGHNLQTEGPT